MAKITDNTDLSSHGNLNPETNGLNWISQINAGGTVYDIATHHKITFKDGNTAVDWNGLTDVEIVIPTITDLIQDPIKFVGTVGANGKVMSGETEITKFGKGDLIFITEDCEFVGIACEAGDMAIFDGTNWKVVSGENQVEIVAAADGTSGDAANKHTVKVGAAQDVLTVEGKTLAIVLDYADLNVNHLDVTKAGSAAAAVPVKFGNMTVGSKFINLSQGADKAQTIGKTETIQKASKLTNGEVTFTGTDALVTDVNWGTFNQGSLSELVLNEDARTFGVTGGSIVKNTAEDFVSSVTLGNVTFDSVTSGVDGAFALVGGIQAGEGQSFVTGVNGASEFTVAGCYQPDENGTHARYVKAIDGNYVTSLNAGSFSLEKGDKVAVGFTTEASTGDVLSTVSVAPSTTDVFSSATVKDHVLSFGTSTVVNDVTTTVSYKSLDTVGYTYTPTSANTSAFANAGFTKAADTKYTLNTSNETVYSTTSAYYKLTTPALGITKGGYELSNEGMVANVSAKTFGVSLTGGVLPTLGASTLVKTADVKGSVATGLDYVDVTINAVDPSAMTINLPGVYTLADNATEGVAVGVAGELTAKNATIDLSNFVTDVAIVDAKS